MTLSWHGSNKKTYNHGSSTPFHGRPSNLSLFPPFHRRPSHSLPLRPCKRSQFLLVTPLLYRIRPASLGHHRPAPSGHAVPAFQRNPTTIRAAHVHHAALPDHQNMPVRVNTMPVLVSNIPPRVRVRFFPPIHIRLSPPSFLIAGFHPLLRHKHRLKPLRRPVMALRYDETPATIPLHG